MNGLKFWVEWLVMGWCGNGSLRNYFFGIVEYVMFIFWCLNMLSLVLKIEFFIKMLG